MFVVNGKALLAIIDIEAALRVHQIENYEKIAGLAGRGRSSESG